jgi:Uma2 family endonuclease
MFAEIPQNHMTLAAYMRNELEGEVRHEYVEGYVYAMAGAKPPHVDLTQNLAGLLWSQVTRAGCFAAAETQLVKTADHCYLYPDAYALCGERKYTDDPVPALTNFAVIFEVLSQSTRNYDVAEKFRHYRTTSSLREYIIIATDRAYIEHHVRIDDITWTMQEITDLQATLTLKAVKAQLPLTEIYRNVLK